MRVIFMGTPDFAVPVVEAVHEAGHEVILCVTQPDRPRGRGGAVQMSDVKQWALGKDIPVLQPDRIRKPEYVDQLRAYPADLAVVAAFGQILPREVLEMPRLGCINVHASLLPKYRGAAPIQWSILNGDDVTGVTIMQMAEGLDDGDILAQEEVPIAPDETGGSLFEKLSRVGARLCVETMDKLEKGEVTPVPQDESQATKVGLIEKSLGSLDFSLPAQTLERYIRGLSPWPGAFTYLEGRMLKIFSAKIIPASPNQYPVGGVIMASDDEIVVKTGQDYLVLEELQLEGKKRMRTAEFLRGRSIREGTILGGEG